MGTVNTNLILPELQAYPNWVCGREDKSPVDPRTGKDAKADDPSSWGSYGEAANYLQTHRGGRIRTIGFEVGESPFTGVEIDHCRDPETGSIEPWGMEIIKDLDTYTEISPCSTGLRMFVTVEDNASYTNKKKGGLGESGKGALEIANGGKYFSVTGEHLEGTPTWIGHRPEELKVILDRYFPQAGPSKEVAKPIQPVSLADEEILQKMFQATNGAKNKKLFEGDHSDYSSQSEADLALCSALAFWTGRDAERMDRLFRQSGLYRENWDEKHGRDTYGNLTIEKAIEGRTEIYQGINGTPKQIGPGSEAQIEDTQTILPFPDVMEGLAGAFADLYAKSLEVPKHFFFMGFLTCLGSVVADRVTLATEIRPQPRLNVIFLGESAEDRKSTGITKTVEFFHMRCHQSCHQLVVTAGTLVNTGSTRDCHLSPYKRGSINTEYIYALW